jgi:replicative DNA helicase
VLRKGLDYDYELEARALVTLTDCGNPGELGAALEQLPPAGWAREEHRLYVQWLREWVNRGGSLHLADVVVALLQPVTDPRKSWRKRFGMELHQRHDAGDRVPTVASLPHYLTQLRAMWVRRQALMALDSARRGVEEAELYEVGQRATDALATVREAVSAADVGPRVRSLDEQLDDMLMNVQNRAQDGGRDVVGFGIMQLDHYCSALPSDLVAIGARPATGKTALVLQGLLANAQLGKRVAAANYEMSVEQMLHRSVAQLSGLDSRILARRPWEMEQHHWDRLLQAREDLGSLDLHLADNMRWTAEDLDRWVVGIGGVDVLAVDYLQIVPPMDATVSRERQVGQTCTRLKQLAKERNCVVWMVVQLNRSNVAGKEARAPIASDIRASGQVEQDADTIVLGWRPDDEDTDRQWLVRKARHGPTGSCILSFDGSRQLFGRGGDDVDV